MPDPKQTVDTIRAYLGSHGTGVSGQLAGVAADYAEMCRQANLRLRRCADFLRDGFRGEAVAYAQARPPLVDLVSDLQFHELADWEQTCTTLGLTRPVRLAVDTATTLGEAQRQQEPLRELLAKHRFLALSQADLPARLEVLRQLIAADPQTTCWKRDLEELTLARTASLLGDATAAIRAGDTVAVDKLLAEVNGGVTAAPADMKDGLARASAAFHESAAIAKLRDLIPRVREASAAMSYDECYQVFAQWGKIVKEAKLSVPPDLREEILPLARRLDEMDDRRDRERDFRKACDGLKIAIADEVPLEQLTALHRAALGYELDLPEELAGSYRRATEVAKRAAHKEMRKQWAITLLLIGIIAIALGVLAYVIIHRH